MTSPALTEYARLLRQADQDLTSAGVYDLEKYAGIIDDLLGIGGIAARRTGDAVEGMAAPFRRSTPDDLPTGGTGGGPLGIGPVPEGVRGEPAWVSELGPPAPPRPVATDASVGGRPPIPVKDDLGEAWTRRSQSPKPSGEVGPRPGSSVVRGQGSSADPQSAVVAPGASVPDSSAITKRPAGDTGPPPKGKSTSEAPEKSPDEGPEPKTTTDADGDGTPDTPEGPSMWSRLGRLGAVTGGVGGVGGLGYVAGKGSAEEEAERRRNLAFGAGMATGVAAPRVLQGVGSRLSDLGMNMQQGYGPSPYGGY